jgi:cytoskeletal protein RodZ
VSIGEALAQARHHAGLSLTEVSQRTRIRETIIAGIEADDYSACGGDFYARGHIRAIARVVGTSSEPLIEEYDAVRLGPPPDAEEETSPIKPVRGRERRRRGGFSPLWVVLVLVVVVVGLAGYYLAGGSGGSAQAARSHPAARLRSAHSQRPRRSRVLAGARASSKPTVAPATAAPAVALAPVSATAFGAGGAGQGDNAGMASLAIDGSASTAWQTDWYTSPAFGGLYQGTGLLVDMGRPVTVMSASVTLGSARGAAFQVRVGDAPSLGSLPVAASATDAGGVVRLRLARPARGRYVLLWFTSLPPDSAGTYQASVYNVQLTGHP